MKWCAPPASLDIPTTHVDVWRVFLDLELGSLRSAESILSTDETERAARFHFDRDRDHFIVAHSSLRAILSRYIHREPHELEFSTNEYGKPTFLSDTKIEFNISHSGEYALIAVARARKVGIDVERIRRDVEFESLAQRYFSPKEVAELMSLPSEQKPIAFYIGWTRKEAYIKAQGFGLSLPLGSFDVSLNEPVALRATRPDPREAARWNLFSLDVAPGYAGALVVESDIPNAWMRARPAIRCWDWNPAIR
jgi:4'-phosphopantetheinyl transferase